VIDRAIFDCQCCPFMGDWGPSWSVHGGLSGDIGLDSRQEAARLADAIGLCKECFEHVEEFAG